MLKNFVEQINQEFLKEAKSSPKLMEDMAYMEKYMAESYGGRVFIELLQNADDVRSTKIKIFEFKGGIIFANNGRPFNESDLLSISRSGASNKIKGETIGFRGVGFKSTTYLSDEILIYSNDTFFSFSKNICSQALNLDKGKVPTVRIPFLVKDIESDIIDLVQTLKNEGFSTIFIFKEAKHSSFFNELDEVNNGYFLFLKNITECDLFFQAKNRIFKIKKEKTSKWDYVLIEGEKVEEWVITGNNKTKIAFKYSKGQIIPCENHEALFHCYLPTIDQVTFPLKIHSEFSTDPSRKHMVLEEETEKALKEAAKNLFEIISDVINGKVNLELFSQIGLILSQQNSFSKLNLILRKYFEKLLIEQEWLLLENGKALGPKDYKILPHWLEGSEKEFLRNNSTFVKNNSLKKQIYSEIPEIEDLLKKYSQKKYSSQDFLEIMEEDDLTKKINLQTQGKIIAQIIKGVRNESLYSQVAFPCKGIKKLLAQNKGLQEYVSQFASQGEIEWFCKKFNLSNFYHRNEEEKEFWDKGKKEVSRPVIFEKKPTISKWRSVEQKCLQIEEYLGNRAFDVSKQNLGYDIESIGKDGKEKYIEVKSLNYKGMPFSLTNNEYTAAHQLGETYYICLIIEEEKQISAIYIKDPLNSVALEKRIRQWEWYCDDYQGEEINIEI